MAKACRQVTWLVHASSRCTLGFFLLGNNFPPVTEIRYLLRHRWHDMPLGRGSRVILHSKKVSKNNMCPGLSFTTVDNDLGNNHCPMPLIEYNTPSQYPTPYFLGNTLFLFFQINSSKIRCGAQSFNELKTCLAVFRAEVFSRVSINSTSRKQQPLPVS